MGLVIQDLGLLHFGETRSSTQQGDPGTAGLKGDRVSVGMGEGRGKGLRVFLTPLTIPHPLRVTQL